MSPRHAADRPSTSERQLRSRLGAARRTRGPRPRSLRIEVLEDRRMLADLEAHWIGGSGNWSDPTNWDIGVAPHNSGTDSYAVVVDLPGSDAVITVDQAATVTSLTNSETLRFATGSNAITSQLDNSGIIQVTAASAALMLSGTVTNSGNVIALNGTLQFSAATVANAGRTIAADGGVVLISNSVITGGTLLATDNASSLVQFAGDVTLNGVGWEDPGAGEFQVNQTSARLLGDRTIAAGQVLVLVGGWTAEATLNVDGGTFTNNGTIEIRGGYYAFSGQGLHFLGDAVLTGTGQIDLTTGYGNTGPRRNSARLTGEPGVTVTVEAGQEIHGIGSVQVDLINHGAIVADVAGQALNVGSTLDNQGVMQAVAGGTLGFFGRHGIRCGGDDHRGRRGRGSHQQRDQWGGITGHGQRVELGAVCGRCDPEWRGMGGSWNRGVSGEPNVGTAVG